MAANLFYYLLALNIAASCFLVYAIVATEFRSRRERREHERIVAACSEIKRLQVSNSTEQHELSEEQHDEDTLELIKQLQTELNERVLELEKER